MGKRDNKASSAQRAHRRESSSAGNSTGTWSAGRETERFFARGRVSSLLFYGLAGLLSGVLLGLALKAVQHFTGHEVYRLLLNADYVPVLKEFRLSERAEFGIHLVISIVLCIILGLIWERLARGGRLSGSKMTGATAAVGILIGALLYPTTLLSSGGTPPIDSLPSWLWWLSVHAVYGAVSGVLLFQVLRVFLFRRSGY
ncbi:hypothetical protein [Saccharibacillus sacchari]|uniref:Uncharacterized protein n=1 Tax=Saccharibacillus sacchari TaxID=456493 RepID=A0ACC6PJG7_9BACL